jgi:hypothetical protein
MQGIGNFDFGAWGNAGFGNMTSTALATGGALFSGLRYATVRSDGYWLGNNGKYYRPGWGGNQHTGARSIAHRTANTFKVAGRVVGVVGMGFTVYDMLEGRKSLTGEGGLDLIMGGVGFIGPWGALASALYFGGKWALIETGYDFWNRR